MRRSGGRLEQAALLTRGRQELDAMAAAAAAEYAAWTAALDAAAATEQTLGEALRRGGASTAVLATAVAAA
ncbi:hypothetical protein LG634_25670, partial [Streptomyces bambusae]|nr:hypothetical protein [Streptomyces bambusae]